MKKILFIFFSTIFLFFLCFASFSIYWLNTPSQTLAHPVRYFLKPGTSFIALANDLEKYGIIDSEFMFVLYGKMFDNTRKLKVGTYDFEVGESPAHVLEKIGRGDTVFIKVTIAEGLNMYQVSQKLMEYFPQVKKEIWLEYMTSPEFLEYLGINHVSTSVEGFLYPDTYFFDPNDEPKFVIKNMLISFKKNISEPLFIKAKELGLSPLHFVTLASIVEKETGLGAEREKVAGVYWNRLRINMRLQADPTVIYGIWPTYAGKITKKDLLTHSPYNTYTNYGLPIGPIANPGKASFLAVLNPEKSENIYFVATGVGGHIFSKTLKDHNKAVAKYLNTLRQRQKQN